MHSSIFLLLFITCLSYTSAIHIKHIQSLTQQISAINYDIECNVGQGYNYKADEHLDFGYITSFVIGDTAISPDIRVIDPSTITSISTVSGSGGSTGTGTTSIFSTPVVGVLEHISWSTLPSDPIAFTSRISISNAQTLQMLVMQSLSKVVVQISFVVYKYDLVNQRYYTSFQSYQGSAPSGIVTPKPGFGTSTSKSIYAKIGKTSGTEYGIKVSPKATEDPIGIRNHVLDLVLAPIAARSPQQILLQTSSTIKLFQPWGLSQA